MLRTALLGKVWVGTDCLVDRVIAPSVLCDAGMDADHTVMSQPHCTG